MFDSELEKLFNKTDKKWLDIDDANSTKDLFIELKRFKDTGFRILGPQHFQMKNFFNWFSSGDESSVLCIPKKRFENFNSIKTKV